MLEISDAEYKKYKKYYGVVYVIKDITNGKLYVGQTTNIRQRIRQYRYEANNLIHWGLTRKIRQALRKGLESFDFNIVDTANNSEELNKKETEWIMKLDTTNTDIGYNSNFGGDSCGKGKVATIKSKEKIDKMKIPIVAYKDGIFKYYDSAKLFGRYINMPRTHITRAAKRGLKVKGYLIFYYDKTLCSEVSVNIHESLSSGQFTKKSDKQDKSLYLKLCNDIIHRNVEIIRKHVIVM